jgi:hypothetical protein
VSLPWTGQRARAQARLGPIWLLGACLVGATGAGCSRSGAQAAQPSGRAKPPSATRDTSAIPDGAASPSFSPLLVPTDNRGCPSAFPHGYRFVGSTEAEARQLFKLIWRDGVSRGDYVVATSPTSPHAAAARCFAVGPHRDLNIAAWCCR